MESLPGALEVLNLVRRIGAEPEQQFPVERECIRGFRAYIRRLEVVLEQIKAVYDNVEVPASYLTALEAIQRELIRAEGELQFYRARSQFYVLGHSRDLNSSLEQRSRSIGKWLLFVPLEDKKLKERVEVLAAEMEQASYKVTEAEEKCCLDLEKGLNGDAMLAGSLWRDMARLIGLDPESNAAELVEQVQLLKDDFRDLGENMEMQKLSSIFDIFEQVKVKPKLIRMYSHKKAMEEAPLEPFESFLCPLTRQLMKDPVIIETEITYERSAIECWFKTCKAQGREVTCPVTGSKLSSENLKGNLMLRQTIEEWFRRNAKIRIQQATVTLSDGNASPGKVEEALDGVLSTFDEGPGDKYTLNRSGLIPLIIELWKRKVPDNSHIRSKGLLVLLNVASDDIDAQEMLAEAGALKCAVRSLSSDTVNEVENALKLVYKMSKRPSIARRLGNLKGAIIHLLAIASNASGNASLSLLAEKTLKSLETVDDNVQQMAEAGRLEPLFARLCNGTKTTQIQMAKFLAEKKFVDMQRDLAAKKAANVLVDMLSGNPKTKQASMLALSNLSKLEDNIPVLVRAGVIPPLVHGIFSKDVESPGVKDAAAETLASIVSVAGSWEDAPIDKRNNRLHSKAFLHPALELISSISQRWNSTLLHIFIGIVSSGDSAAKHFVSGKGVDVLLVLVEQTGELHLLQVLKLLSLLSGRVGAGMVFPPKWLKQLKGTLLRNTSEQSIYAAAIISNVKLSEADITGILGSDVLTWCISEARSRKSGSGSARLNSAMLEGLTGILVQFARCSDEGLLNTMKQHRLMEVFCDNLQIHGQAMTKQRAAVGLMLLSQKSWQFPASTTANSKERWSWIPAFCMSRPGVEGDLSCPLHRTVCMSGESFCLVKANAIKPLIELLDDEDREVQLRAVEALSTLVLDKCLEAGVNELNKAGATRAAVKWFQTARLSAAAQERGVYLIERILRVEEQAKRFSLDQGLVMRLVEVFERGSGPAKRIAEAALAHASMLSARLSVISSKARE